MMTEGKNTHSRRDALRKLFQVSGYMGMGGLLWGGMADELAAGDLMLRPPAAIDEKNFLKACLKCGSCVEACPYDSLKLAKPKDNVALGTPFFEPRDIPCYMCTHVPCVPVCPSGALSASNLSNDLESAEMDINKAKMGTAVIHKETCIAFWGVQCDACYRACPLIDSAITLKYEKNERTGKHAFLLPIVSSDNCTGCGLCEHACVTEQPAIRVLPVDVAQGVVGSHYIKGWDKDDEKRLINAEEVEVEYDESEAIDYLNDLEGLIDD